MALPKTPYDYACLAHEQLEGIDRVPDRAEAVAKAQVYATLSVASQLDQLTFDITNIELRRNL